MNWNKIILIVVLLSCLTSFSQKMELGEVTIDELKEKKHPKDSTANAAVLFKKAIARFYYDQDKGFYTKTEFEYKIKIYKKEGLKWADFVIPFYTGNDRTDEENIEISKAAVYNFENGKIIKSKVAGDAKIEKSIDDFWDTKTIVFPNVKEGSIMELKYTHKSLDFDALPSFQFQYEIPVNQAEYITEIPEFYKYKMIKNSEVEFSLDQKFESATQNYNNEIQVTQSRSFVYTQIKSVFKFKNVPALIEEDYAGNMDNFYGKIEHELESVNIQGSASKNITKTWNDVGKLLMGQKTYQSEIKKYNYFMPDLKALLKGVNDKEEMMKMVFGFVKNRMSWNSKNSFFLRNPIEDPYAQKVGNSAEINFILLAMLRMSGIEANPVFISTKKFGYADYPNLAKLNYVLVAAKIEGKRYILDATDKLSNVNMPPVRTLNWFGREIKEDGTAMEVDLFSTIQSKENTNVMASLAASGEVSGMIKKQKTDYNAFLFREKDGKLTQEDYLEKLEKDLNNSEISEYIVENKSDPDKPIVETFSFKNDNSVEIIGDKIYFSPLLFFAQTVNPFKQEKREYPVDFVFPNQEKYLSIINIPEGYMVEAIPAPIAVAFTDNVLSYKFNISSNGKQIQVSSVFDIKTSVLSPEDYEELKNFFAEMIKKQTEKVVLKKA